jgi:E3 ubiquitin-protein ligase HUWE1
MAQGMFNVNYGLFSRGSDGTYLPNPLSYANSDHLDWFRACGRIVGKAIAAGFEMNAHFSRAFFKHILDIPVSYRDIEAVDPTFFKSIKMILEQSIDDLYLGLTFSADEDNFGQRRTVPLKPGGEDIDVTDANKAEYVQLVARHRLTSTIQAQTDAFLKGFHELVPKRLVTIFNQDELELLLCGTPEIDIDDLEANTVYNGYSAKDKVIVWFWRTLRAFTQEERARFIQFTTGTSQVPADGFKALVGMRGPQKFQVTRAHGNVNALPQAHTCFNQLDLPAYTSEAMLREKLSLAIFEGGEGFQLA